MYTKQLSISQLFVLLQFTRSGLLQIQFTMENANSPEMPDASRVYSTFVDSPNSQSTVIVGAGIIGCATAYYLANSGNTRPDTIHLIEASPELFASASGRAAGFVAPDCEYVSLEI